MKKLISCLLILSCAAFRASGQAASPADTTKYRINLPDYWRPGNKVWQILIDKLPLVCEELKDKQVCGDDCRPKYFIEFEMTPPVVYAHNYNHVSSDYANTVYKKPSDTWDINSYYSFECYLLLLDEKDRLITKFIVVDSMEEWVYTTRVRLPSYAPPPAQMLPIKRTNRNTTAASVIDYNPANPATWVEVGQEGQTPYAYINENKEKLGPANKDLFLIVDRKINSW